MNISAWLGEKNKIGIDIWERKYKQPLETFDLWLERVSGGDEEVAKLILAKRFLPGGRILANRGLNKEGINVTLSNCYVISPPEDNIESIFEAASKLARTFSYGGGCGIDIGNLRPRGAAVNNTAKHSSGAVSFMDIYNTTTGTLGQNGRRGALMISIPVNHPDVLEFITAKGNADKLTNANISIRVDDNFMQAVVNNEEYVLEFEDIKQTVNARELFAKICKNNWGYAEPGILFWDRIESHNLLSQDPEFKYAGVNPCAEEPLPAGGSCLLGSMNLAAYVKNAYTPQAHFDFKQFKKDIHIAVRCLNDVLQEGLPLHPLEEQRNSVSDWRQIGLGIMGLADCLIELGLVYGSDESIHFAGKVARTMFIEAVIASERLGGARGEYPMYSQTHVNNSPMLKAAGIETEHLANSQLLTIAPTGTLSTMLGISGGIEPIFANSYTRKTQSLYGKDTYYEVYTPIVKQYMEMHNLSSTEELPEYFITAPEIHYENRLSMQAAFQKWIDASISSTINLPQESTEEDIMEIYIKAWLLGLKGVTIYRAGCAREGVLVSSEENKETVENKANNFQAKRGDIYSADDNVIGLKRKLQTGCGSLHVQAFFDPTTGLLQETYFSKGSAGGCNNFMIGLSRTISLLARAGVAIEDIIDQLNSTGVCPSYATRKAIKNDTSPGSCCPMAIGKALLEMSGEMQDLIESNSLASKQVATVPEKVKINKCPRCEAPLVMENGCVNCKECGWSKCD